VINRTTAGAWRVRVKFRGVVVADQTFARKGEATRWEADQRRHLMDGDFVSPAAGRMTVRELAAEYETARSGAVAERSWESDESALRVHIVPAFGDLPLSSLTSVQVESFLLNIAKSRSVRTAARVRTTLRGLLLHAVKTRRLRVSPAEGVPLPRTDTRAGVVVAEVNPFTLPELLSVVQEQTSHDVRYAQVTLVLGLTGLRMGELRGLRARDVVVVPYPALVVRRSLPQSARTGRVIERNTTKSGRTRMVPLSDLARPVIEKWATGLDPEGLVFPAPGGGYLRAQNWRRQVHWTETGRGRRPHDLRHTAATLWIGAGVDIKTVSAWLGHSTAKLTLDTYGHYMGADADRAAMIRVNQIYADASRTPGPDKSVPKRATGGPKTL